MNGEPGGTGGGVRVVLVTVPDVDAGVILARRAVDERLAACGNVIPGLTSVYRWEGEIQEDPEALVIFKTRADTVEQLRKRVEEIHPYDVPEFLALSITHGSEAYLDWVVREVKDPEVPG
ncbi:MAG: divalent-cation tolerance protein CutA [Gemmatimonadota bacterium]|jgi:periplasmic divalent cation tolerance protein